MKFMDLCCGIGGFHIAANDYSGECIAACDIEPKCKLTYELNHKFKAFYTSLELLYLSEPYDLLCAGFPCQPFSSIGLKQGFADTRGTVFHSLLEIVEKTLPPYIFLENVLGLLSDDQGRTLTTIVSALENLGYTVQVFRASAADYGLPQNRRRVFILCNRKGKAVVPPPTVPLQFTLSDLFGEKTQRDIALTIRTTGLCRNPEDTHNWQAYYTESGVRTLNSDMCLRLQGFPEWFRFPDTISERQRIKLIGNSVAIPAISAFMGRLLDV